MQMIMNGWMDGKWIDVDVFCCADECWLLMMRVDAGWVKHTKKDSLV
jgi:hypothetical protein